MHRVELKAVLGVWAGKNMIPFLMHRVELKGEQD